MHYPSIAATAGIFLAMLVCSTTAISETEEMQADSQSATDPVETKAKADATIENKEAEVTDTKFGEDDVPVSAIPKATDIREEIEQTAVKVYVNNPPKRFTLLKKLRSEVFVIDARSESDAEVVAFKQLKAKAKELGADGLIEVKRSIVKDSVAQLETPVVTGSMLGLDIDSTAVPVDELMLHSYSLNKGTLSNRIIEQTFDRTELSQKAIRFTGKAIKLEK